MRMQQSHRRVKSFACQFRICTPGPPGLAAGPTRPPEPRASDSTSLGQLAEGHSRGAGPWPSCSCRRASRPRSCAWHPDARAIAATSTRQACQARCRRSGAARRLPHHNLSQPRARGASGHHRRSALRADRQVRRAADRLSEPAPGDNRRERCSGTRAASHRALSRHPTPRDPRPNTESRPRTTASPQEPQRHRREPRARATLVRSRPLLGPNSHSRSQTKTVPPPPLSHRPR